MQAGPFDAIGQARITQLINKTNQFNLTTRRYTDQDVAAMMDDPDIITCQIRLTDKYGDNGMISVLIARPSENSGRVDDRHMAYELPRIGAGSGAGGLEFAGGEARKRGYQTIIGEFRPTEKNALVRDHYAAMGFSADQSDDTGNSFWRLSVEDYVPLETSHQYWGKLTVTDLEIMQGITEIVREALDDDTIILTPTSVASDFAGWDSFKHITIVVATEMRFGSQVPDRGNRIIEGNRRLRRAHPEEEGRLRWEIIPWRPGHLTAIEATQFEIPSG